MKLLIDTANSSNKMHHRQTLPDNLEWKVHDPRYIIGKDYDGDIIAEIEKEEELEALLQEKKELEKKLKELSIKQNEQRKIFQHNLLVFLCAFTLHLSICSYLIFSYECEDPIRIGGVTLSFVLFLCIKHYYSK